MIRHPVLIVLSLVSLYLAYAFGESALCYTHLKRNPISRFRSNEQLWEECKRDHLMFPFYYFVP